ncbi:sigma E regulatory protein, MucB/RseB [Thermomonospora echinospora]|uniref:Sigma E regulatory protein, MucB/RseB n=1 Tax=Thermomonospora echinospora TaxID=1992 RepID=A0A1H6A2S5_9ACTN|nr:MucB/RseB C-terminal domain-containing protein [Thermomonospora echinospora]SEG42046.1 sigma E regulatory protein, MucB/RseB [Thermomonospora echinospora]
MTSAQTTPFGPSGPFGGRSAWVVGGLAAALLLAWTLAGNAGAGRRADSDPEALELLRETAAAARRTPYEGTQIRTTLTGGGHTRTAVKVAHATDTVTPLHGILVQDASSTTGGAADVTATGGLAGFTPALLALLTRNYTVVQAADDDACGRAAHVVEARRADGGTAGRFRIDAETGIMLHRELLDDGGRVVSALGFSDVRIAEPRTPAVAGASRAAPWAAVGAAEVAGLRGRGWTVPQDLPGGFVLNEVRRSGPADGGTLHLGYSDGLAAVSVFVQRGRLDERRLAGWRRSGAVFHREDSQRWAVWAADGHVYTVVTDAPRAASDTVVAALPQADTGLWGRLRRGVRRIGTWANPWN